MRPLSRLNWISLLMGGLLLGNLLTQEAFAMDELPIPTAFGLNTMAPESSWGIRFEQRNNDYHQTYDQHGNLQGLGASFDGIQLNSSIFPSLALLGPGASLGTTRFKSEVRNQISTLTIGYGITPDITIGAIIPYVKSHTRVSFGVDGGNVGANPAFDASQPISAGNFPFAPAGGAVAPMDTAGVQNILTNPAYGYQYKQIASQQSEGFSDPTIGVLWRAYKAADQSLIVGIGWRVGLARKDDPDNLLDTPPGDGSDDLRTRIEYFKNIGSHLDLRLLADYNWQTRDKASMRIPSSGQLLALASSKQRLQRDLGDFYETDIELGYRWSNWRWAATWHRYEKQSDTYRSDLGTDTSSLETNTYTRADQYRLSATWSGIQAWQQGKLPLPLIVRLEMQDTFSGRNFVDVRDIYLQVTALFR
ncbi:hypothetical protein Q9292_12750 [Methylophilus sp. VKM B-3414]|uniref:hypothetical protein n=1 Tax=Methylophilus sp. VKM B-3414 TaxID=3076121 RepID=UPI0028C9BB11|nr:hypothetical protein [Methylophilus sp. VKM B-3414]MDT7850481.1 hypothetical protein [Methylophilus sp. VKM B-3414]